MLEGLTKYWGFYFVAVPRASGIGVHDFQDALDDVAAYPGWVSDLETVDIEKRGARGEVNSRIVSKHLRKVLAARVVVFELFLELAIQVHGTLQEKHKRIWLLFQLSNELVHGNVHPFIRILRCLHRASNDSLDVLVERLDDIRGKYLPGSKFILGLDEAQRASRMYPRCFMSTDQGNFVSIIREVVKVFTKSEIKLVVSGTGASLAELGCAMDSGVSAASTPAGAVQLFHKLGMFDTWPKLKSFLKRYIPSSILYSPSGYCLQKRMREYLQGR
jgi:hypothetical protein